MSSVAGITQSEVNAPIHRAIQALIDATLAGDADRVIAAYRPDTPFIEQGHVRARFDELENQIRDFFASYRVIENTLDDIRIVELSESAAVITARYSYSTVSRRGEKATSVGAWSAVFVRESAGWRIVAPHQSAPHPIP